MMTPPHARPAASHCRELVAGDSALADPKPALALIGERLARGLALRLARLSGDEVPSVGSGIPKDAAFAALRDTAEGLASHCLMGMGASDLPLLASFDSAPVFRLVDRAFGGPGEVPEPAPDAFPLSAELLLARLERCLADALTFALGAGDELHVHPLRRDTSLRQLDPFPPDTQLLLLSLEIEEVDFPSWSLTLALPIDTLTAAMASQHHTPVRQGRLATPGPTGEPFASMPLEVTAVLVDMRLGMTRLSALRPGDVLPVAVARSVPLQIGGKTLATGTIGEIDDRVAVQLTHAF